MCELFNLFYGALAEWLGKGLQNLLHRFKSGTRLQIHIQARVVELVYTTDLKSVALRACGFESRPAHQLLFNQLIK